MPGQVFTNASRTNYDFNQSYSKYLTRDPDWKVLVSKRRDASGAYVSRVIRIRGKPVRTSAQYWTGTYPNQYFVNTWKDHSLAFDLLGNANSTDDAALRDLALARLKRKMSSRTDQMNVLIPVVELREFRGLISAMTYSALDLVKALIQIKKTKGKSAAQFASHAWLNWSFAVSPTVSDIAKLRDLINKELFDTNEKVFTEYGAAKKEWFSPYKASSTAGYGVNGTVSSHMQHKLSYRYACGFKTPLRSANDYSSKASFGLEIGALVPALWELTMFSWLADYFTTMGAYLDDTFITDTTQSIYCNCTKRYTVSGYLMFEINDTRPLMSSSNSGVGPRYEYSVTDRSVFSAIPSRILRFKSSDEIAKNAVNKLLNLGSILVGGKAFSNRIKGDISSF